jgi:hypothetical protein
MAVTSDLFKVFEIGHVFRAEVRSSLLFLCLFWLLCRSAFMLPCCPQLSRLCAVAVRSSEACCMAWVVAAVSLLLLSDDLRFVVLLFAPCAELEHAPPHD